MQRMKVAALSGGERNRLLLARLFLEGANVLVLDEPTNDLDIVTLNVLEGLLLGFAGSVLLVTHDRYFLDKVATVHPRLRGRRAGRPVRGQLRDVPAPEGPGGGGPGGGGAHGRVEEARPPAATAPEAPKPARKPGKLSYKEQRELDGMEAAIEAAETRKAELEAKLADPAVYSSATKVPELQRELEAATTEVDRLYARWQELQNLVGSA